MNWERRSSFARLLQTAAVIFTLLSAAAGITLAHAAESTSVDLVMGGTGRADLIRRIDGLAFEGGRKYGWGEFSAWGRDLFMNGQVVNPPAGPQPSTPISKYFKCITCHNDQREDPILTVPDPEARFQWLAGNGLKDIYLVQGVTMWGVVNRTAFYADYYGKYHDLGVPEKNNSYPFLCGLPLVGSLMPGCRTMNANHLDDAIQVCSNYCSAGRFLTEWEQCALLAFFWDQEIRLDDVGLSAEEVKPMQALLVSPGQHPEETQKIRQVLSASILRKAANTYRGIPEVKKDAAGKTLAALYSDGVSYAGNIEQGGRLYAMSCARCHGTENMPRVAKNIAGNAKEFYEMLADGSMRGFGDYMPAFTLERLSRRQAADILAYLRSLL